MNEILAPHSFTEAKNSLQTFSQQSNKKTSLSKVDASGGLFNWFDHKVTGDEFNTLIKQIQEIVKSLKDNDLKMIDEFGAVYNALESLDNEYIPAILTGVKSAEEASNQAKKALDRIDGTIETQEKVIAILKSHKEKLEKLKHLENIDDLWNKQEIQENDLNTIDTRTSKAEEKIQEIIVEKQEIKKSISLNNELIKEVQNGLQNIERNFEKEKVETNTILKDLNQKLHSFSEEKKRESLRIKRLFIGIITAISSIGVLSMTVLILSILKVL